jgi:transcriptional regulator with XRE-family HTH domain
MEGTSGSGLAEHFGKQLRRDRLARGWSIAELARRMDGVNGAHLGRVENGKRPPTFRLAARCDAVFPERKGWYSAFLEDVRKSPEIPATFRSWSDYEERSATLRVWMPGIIDGLLQTPEYAAAMIATSPRVTQATAEGRLASRMERQRRVLGRTEPPRATLLIDQLALYRQVGSPQVMAGQLRKLVEAASVPNITVQVMPAIEHPALASGYVLTDDAVWCEHLAAGGTFTDPDIVSNVAARHDNLRAECFRASESLRLFERLGEVWARGANPLTQPATADSA